MTAGKNLAKEKSARARSLSIGAGGNNIESATAWIKIGRKQ